MGAKASSSCWLCYAGSSLEAAKAELEPGAWS